MRSCSNPICDVLFHVVRLYASSSDFSLLARSSTAKAKNSQPPHPRPRNQINAEGVWLPTRALGRSPESDTAVTIGRPWPLIWSSLEATSRTANTIASVLTRPPAIRYRPLAAPDKLPTGRSLDLGMPLVPAAGQHVPQDPLYAALWACGATHRPLPRCY